MSTDVFRLLLQCRFNGHHSTTVFTSFTTVFVAIHLMQRSQSTTSKVRVYPAAITHGKKGVVTYDEANLRCSCTVKREFPKVAVSREEVNRWKTQPLKPRLFCSSSVQCTETKNGPRMEMIVMLSRCLMEQNRFRVLKLRFKICVYDNHWHWICHFFSVCFGS